MTTSIRDIVRRKPSVAIRATIHGLQTHRNRDDFKLDMGTFGTSRGGVCVGCMATCALQSITNTTFTTDTIHFPGRCKATNALTCDVSDFEEAIEEVRCRNARRLYRYCGLNEDEVESLPHYVAQSVLLCGQPSQPEVDLAIGRLSAFAEELEAKGY